MTPDQREKLEADYTFRRIVELELDPVKGDFDVAHLKEVNRRIFQDLPAAGFDDVTPGEFRPPVPDGKDWMKNRGLSTVDGAFYVAYVNLRLILTRDLHRILTCSFAGRIDPLRLTLPPGPRERRDSVVRPLETQFF